jgi:hypothetical protein
MVVAELRCSLKDQAYSLHWEEAHVKDAGIVR